MRDNNDPNLSSLDFSKIRIGNRQNLNDPVLKITDKYKGVARKYSDKEFILQKMTDHNYNELRKISNFYYESSGIYQRLCKYMAFLYRYDWYLIPHILSDSVNNDRVLKDFYKVSQYFEKSHIPQMCGDVALSVIKNGCYYGYVTDNDTGVFLQELPYEYCRSRFSRNGYPVVEFNMRYFDDTFSDPDYRLRIIKSFPKEFYKGYVLYHQGKLKPDFSGDVEGWYLLNPDLSVKFTFSGSGNGESSDFPILVNAIPAIIDLDNAQDLDRQKTLQRLLKILIQKLPIDKNGDLIFDLDEAASMHSLAVQMLRNAVGVDVMTTFADVDVADLTDSNTATTTDDLEKVERTVYNEFGVSRNLFNSDSNLALQYSVLDDEASIRSFPLQLEAFFNRVIQQFNTSPKKYYFAFKMLETTIYNYKDMSKMYKEQTQIGFSKMLPQIALGHTQGEIIATAKFENEVLGLNDIMVPPLMSSTMSSKDVLDKNNSSSGSKNQDNNEGAGRPSKDDSEKSDKTIQNNESM